MYEGSSCPYIITLKVRLPLQLSLTDVTKIKKSLCHVKGNVHY